MGKAFSIPKEELYDLYAVQRKPIGEIANHFSCCKAVVHQRVKAYGIPKRRPIGWTEQEFQLLKEKYATSTNAELAQLLPNKSPRAVAQAACSLHLKKNRKVLMKRVYDYGKKYEHDDKVRQLAANLSKPGYRIITFTRGDPIPDLLIIQGRDVKVFAGEVQVTNDPNVAKYEKCKLYDDIWWFIIKGDLNCPNKIK